jgi:AI-2 transport protein TqsA
MAHESGEQNYLITVSLVILAFVALAVTLVYTRTVMIPFVLALFIVSMVAPVQDFQVKRLRFPRVIASVVTLFVVFFVVALVSLLVALTIDTVVSTARDYSASMAYVANLALAPLEVIYQEETAQEPEAPNEPSVKRPVAPVASDEQVEKDQKEAEEKGPWLQTSLLGRAPADPNKAHSFTAPPLPPPSTQTEGDAEKPGVKDPNKPAAAKPPRKLDTRKLVTDLQKYMFNILTNAVGTIFGLISGVFFVVIFVMFLVVGHDPYATHSEIYVNIVKKVRRYVGTKVAISLVTGVLVWVSLTRLGLPLASVFGILAFLLNFIPSIGSIISTLLPIPVAVATFRGETPQGEVVVYWGTVLLVVAVPGAIQMIMGNMIEPKLMGEGLNLHPVTVLLALSFWGLLWGIVGMFLAAPITAAIRIVFLQFDTLRPIGNLLAGDFAKPVIAVK